MSDMDPVQHELSFLHEFLHIPVRFSCVLGQTYLRETDLNPAKSKIYLLLSLSYIV